MNIYGPPAVGESPEERRNRVRLVDYNRMGYQQLRLLRYPDPDQNGDYASPEEQTLAVEATNFKEWVRFVIATEITIMDAYPALVTREGSEWAPDFVVFMASPVYDDILVT